MKTRYAILQENMKSKDKFIDELLKSTQFMNQAILQGIDAKGLKDMMAAGGIKNQQLLNPSEVSPGAHKANKAAYE